MLLVVEEVDARKSPAADRLERAHRQVAHPLGHAGRERRRHDHRVAVAEVLLVEVEPAAGHLHLADDRRLRRVAAEHAALQLARPDEPLLDQHDPVVRQRRLDGRQSAPPAL